MSVDFNQIPNSAKIAALRAMGIKDEQITVPCEICQIPVKLKESSSVKVSITASGVINCTLEHYACGLIHLGQLAINCAQNHTRYEAIELPEHIDGNSEQVGELSPPAGQ